LNDTATGPVKFVPLIVTLPETPAPVEGEKLVIVGGGSYVNPFVALPLVPPGVVTLTATLVCVVKIVPGVFPVMLVAEMLVIVRLLRPAKLTVVFPGVVSNPVPVIVTEVPPATGPNWVESEPVIVGTCS
jgi:hypothetical protein